MGITLEVCTWWTLGSSPVLPQSLQFAALDHKASLEWVKDTFLHFGFWVPVIWTIFSMTALGGRHATASWSFFFSILLAANSTVWCRLVTNLQSLTSRKLQKVLWWFVQFSTWIQGEGSWGCSVWSLVGVSFTHGVLLESICVLSDLL